MPLGKEHGSYSFKVSSYTLTPGDGGAETAQVNMEGQATIDGNREHVIGTMTIFPDIAATTGRWEWISRAFADDHTRVARGGGFFNREASKTQARGTIHASDGASFAVEGVLDTNERTFSGKAYEWK